MTTTRNNAAIKAILVMFSSFNFSGDEAEKNAKLDAYWDVLSELSPEEIITVCKQASRGEIGDGKFLPAAAQLYQAARPRSAARGNKPSPDWRPGQDRFLSSDGTLYIRENGRNLVYTAQELHEFGYALPAPPKVLNHDLLLARGVEPIKRISSVEPPANADNRVSGLVRGAIKGL